MSDSDFPDVIEFSDFRLHLGSRRLFDPDGKTVSLTAKAFDALAYFLENPGRVLDKQELMDVLWPNVVVEENALNQVISAVRRALDDRRDMPRFIATIQGRGYQFIATDRAVSPPTVEGRAATPRARIVAAVFVAVMVLGTFVWFVWQQSAPVTADPSVAVMAFVNLSGNPNREYFSDGVSDEIHNQLSQIDGLRVTALSSSFAFKDGNTDVREVGRVLGVGHVVEGSVRLDDDIVRITARLVRTSDGTNVWSQSYDSRPDEILAVHSDIARNVVTRLSETLGLRISGETLGAGTKSVAAWDFYQRGRAQMNMRGFDSIRRGGELLSEAVALDPEFLDARLALIEAIASNSLIDPPWNYQDTLAELGREIERARELAPNDWRVLRLRAHYFIATNDWAAAADAAARSMTAAPPSERNCGIGLLMPSGDAAIDCARSREASDPISRSTAVSVQNALVIFGRYDEAALQYRRVQTLPGDDAESEYFEVLRLILTNADPAVIRTHMQRFIEIDDLSLPVMSDLAESPGDGAAARAALRVAVDDPAYQRDPFRQSLLAQLAAAYGDPQLTVRVWTKLVALRAPIPDFWTPLYTDARRTDDFKRLVESLGLVDYWRQHDAWNDYCRPVDTDDFECF